MTNNMKGIISILTAFVFVSLFISCSRDNDLSEEATFPVNGEVFLDNFSAGLNYNFFEGAVPTAFEVVSDVTYEGSAAMRIAVPDVGDPAGSYAGGAFFTGGGRDLSSFNALTFWVRASQAAVIDVLGFGVDLGENTYQASIAGGVFVNTNWKKVIIPIPNPEVLTEEKGMFYFSEGPEDGRGYTFWIDEVQFENLTTIASIGPEMFGGEDAAIMAETGDNPPIEDLVAVFNLPSGQNVSVNAAPAYYTFNSSNPSVATVSSLGVISVMDAGRTVITGSLGEDPIRGSLAIVSTGAAVAPQESAPTPDEAESDVTSIFSDTYSNQPVEFFNGNWEFSTTTDRPYQVGDDNIIRYGMLNFVGIQFTAPTIDISNRNFFHIDLWTPDATEPASDFKILLVDLGSDNSFGGGDDSSHEITVTNPTLVTEDWVSLDIPLSDFVGLTNRSNLAQIVLSSGTISNVYVDNIYFYQGEGGGGGGDPIPPTSSAPTPTQAASDVISIFSDAYTDVPNQGFNLYGGAAFEQVDISGDASLRYTQGGGDGGNFQVIELGGDQIDAEAAGMTNFRFDLYFPNSVNDATNFLLKLVDIPEGGPTEALVNVNTTSNPAMTQGMWLSYDFTLSDLRNLGLGGIGNIQQVVIDLINAGDVYIDNIYFYKDDGTGGGGDDPIDPTSPAPVPTEDAADVISIYSDAYSNVPNQGLNLYGGAIFEEVSISGDGALKYSFADADGGNFQVMELGGDQIDAEAAGMTNFRFDLWFPNKVEASTNFLMKLVDIPGSGPTEALIWVDNMSNPAIAQGSWLSFDIPFTDLEAAGLGGKANIQQVVVDLMSAGAVYIDNIYFYKESGGGGGGTMAPDMPAPTPTQASEDVISIYSNAYSNVPNAGLAQYGAAAFEEVDISGNGALKYTFVDVGGGNFQVMELGGDQIDAEAAGMTNFRFDLWFSNEITSESNFLLKLVDIPGSGPTEALIWVNNMSNPAISQGSWLSFDVPLADLEAAGLGGKSNIQQIVVDLMNIGEVYIDNIFFYNDGSNGGGGGNIAPTSPAPTPSQAAEDVISIYSNAYTNVPNQGFNLYGNAPFEGVDIMGDGALKYSSVEGGGGFQVIELGGDQINAEAAGMTNFRFDLWFSGDVTAESNFLLKLVDIPGGGPTEALIFVNDMSNPAIAQGTWLSFDIPFSDLEAAGLGGKSNIQQVVIDMMTMDEVYIDNIFFYNDGSNGGGGGSMVPNVAAPTPTQAAENVVSIYSDAYTNVANQGLAQYGAAAFEEVSIEGNGALKYTFVEGGGGNFQVMELGGGQIDAEAAGLTNFRFDLWFPNEVNTDSKFLLKLVDIAGAATEALINVTPDGNPPLEQGKWISFDLTFTDLEALGLGGKANIQQVVVDLMNIGEVYIDNIYFYK